MNMPSTFIDPADLEVGVIGLGRMGLRHVQAVQRLGMRVVGVADVAEAARNAACEAHGIEPGAAYADAHAMLRERRPRALVVATTAPTHAEYVLAAAELGLRHILCEKPMACSLAEADAMRAACARHGAALAVNHQMSFMAQYTEVKALLGSEALGPLASIVVAGSNFGLAMNASHYFEMFRYLVGAPVHSVRAWLEAEPLANPRGPQFDDRSGRLLATSAGGVGMFIDFSSGAGWGLNVSYLCRQGQIAVDELNGHMRVAARQAPYRELPTTRYGMPVDLSERAITPADTVQPTMDVWQAMLSGAPHPDATAGRHALACLVAAHLSQERGGVAVALDEIDGTAEARRFHWA
jgi:predicted dehydrogenase